VDTLILIVLVLAVGSLAGLQCASATGPRV
jgi:hypothetical protein